MVNFSVDNCQTGHLLETREHHRPGPQHRPPIMSKILPIESLSKSSGIALKVLEVGEESEREREGVKIPPIFG